jgi:hypothetical protein
LQHWLWETGKHAKLNWVTRCFEVKQGVSHHEQKGEETWQQWAKAMAFAAFSCEQAGEESM